MIGRCLLASLMALSGPQLAMADNLASPDALSSLVSDLKASRIGDSLTVIVVQSAEARNSARNARDRASGASGAIGAGDLSEMFDLS
ncbi:MAG: flagellar basal body L-ring protein FlgH, partial [Pseudomonadota bacterium]